MPGSCLKKSVVSVLFLFLPLALPGCSSVGETVKQIGSAVPAGLKKIVPISNPHKTPGEKEKLDLPPSPYNRVWKKKLPSEGISSPAYSDGTLYLGSKKGLYAFSFDTGRKLWRFKTSTAVDAVPTVDGGVVCFGTRGGVFYCLDRSSGEELWRYHARSAIVSSALISSDTVYFVSAEMKVHALSVSSGEKLWSYGRTAYDTVYPLFRNLIALSYERLYILFPDGYLVTLKADTGKGLWEKKVMDNPILTDGLCLTPFIYKGHVYLINDTGALVIMDANTGATIKDYRETKAIDFTVEDRKADERNDALTRIFLLGKEEVLALELPTGRVLWRSAVSSGDASSFFLKGEHLYVLTNYETSRFRLGFFKILKGNIEAFRLSDGTPLWVEKLDGAASSEADVYRDRIYLVTAKGTLQVFAPEGDSKK